MSGNIGANPLIKHIIIAERAHQESLVKQKRIAQVWNHKTQLARELKKPMGKQAPGWLELSEDGSYYIVDEDKASLVNIIYDKRLSGMSMDLPLYFQTSVIT
ncbi:hypothetical protein [Shigella sonnei]|uniref:hypothetical protein n=1 Tax=Shigella sonnei TaxID=624 RepID=UPI00097DD32D|nr:hypothetical protein [Shigella sonnei]